MPNQGLRRVPELTNLAANTFAWSVGRQESVAIQRKARASSNNSEQDFWSHCKVAPPGTRTLIHHPRPCRSWDFMKLVTGCASLTQLLTLNFPHSCHKSRNWAEILLTLNHLHEGHSIWSEDQQVGEQVQVGERSQQSDQWFLARTERCPAIYDTRQGVRRARLCVTLKAPGILSSLTNLFPAVQRNTVGTNHLHASC